MQPSGRRAIAWLSALPAATCTPPALSAKDILTGVHKAAGAMAAHQAQTKAVAFMDKVKFFAEGHLKARICSAGSERRRASALQAPRDGGA